MANYRPGIVFIGMETSGVLRRGFQALGFETYSADLLPSEDGGEEMAYSDDRIPLGRHMVGDVFDILEHLRSDDLWPFGAVFHPDCTNHTNSGAWAFNDPDYERYPGVGYHQKPKAGTAVGGARRAARDKARHDVDRIASLDIDRIVIENPIGTLTSLRTLGRPSQIIQPYELGEDASKATCLWYLGDEWKLLQPLGIPIDPAKRAPGRMVPREKAMGKSDKANGNTGPAFLERWSNQTDTGQNRLSPGDDRWKDRSRTFPKVGEAIVELVTRGK